MVARKLTDEKRCAPIFAQHKRSFCLKQSAR